MLHLRPKRFTMVFVLYFIVVISTNRRFHQSCSFIFEKSRHGSLSCSLRQTFPNNKRCCRIDIVFLSVIQAKRLSMFSSILVETILDFSFLRLISSVLDPWCSISGYHLSAVPAENILFMLINFIRICYEIQAKFVMDASS